jgi:hypothetical protein
MWWWIVRLPTPFIRRRREGRQCCGGETADDEWSSSILSFQGEVRKGQHPFQKGKGARGKAVSSHVKGGQRMQRRGSGG